MPPPSDPMAVARELLPAFTDDGVLTLRHWRGTWMRWHGAHWAEAEDGELRARLYERLEHAVFMHATKDGMEERKWAPSRRKLGDLVEALASITHLPQTADAPVWLEGRSYRKGESPVVACRNGLLQVSDRKLTDHTPRFFNLVSVPFDYDAGADCPRWREFLSELWPDDGESITALQEWFGYVLSGRTDLHKIVLMVGPTRSGKGTIARILTALVGKGHTAGPTLRSLATNFGLQPLLGKPLAVISDARLSGRDSTEVVERLLTISGEDTLDVDRKYRKPWTGCLPTRFTIMSNELPHFGDSSGVVARRFIVLSMTRSWLGSEDTGLGAALEGELPGILNWALDGLARLESQGRFTEPAASKEAVTTMQDMASPTSAFVRERCVVGAEHSIAVDELWSAWKSWCEDCGRSTGNKATFSRNLTSVAPRVHVRRANQNEDPARRRQYKGIALAPTTIANRADQADTAGQGPVSGGQQADAGGPRQ